MATFEDLVERMRTGGAYVNAHTPAYPGGEIRGQIH
ncbi:MAG TPA: CHRD domain-containing protein [Chryseosolibacter sp.]|nr:CHRD domain-containing protein [Chryseosolibacter sp.]